MVKSWRCWVHPVQPVLRGLKKWLPMVIALTVVTLIILLSPKLSLAEGSTTSSSITISGAISLPAGVTAPSGGLTGEVSLYSQNSAYSQYPNKSVGNSYLTTFTIASGENSVQYTATVPIDATVNGYFVGYHLDDSSNYVGYVGEGYYSSTGTVSMMMANIVDLSSTLDNINLTIFTGNSILGKVSLPEGLVAPTGGIDASIQVWSQTSPEQFSKYIHIPEGGTSADYFVTVPTKAGSTGYQVMYGLNKGYAGLLQSGYYSTLGTAPYYYSSSSVNVGSTNVDNINLTILSGKTISGSILLPQGKIALSGGINGYIYASTQTGGYGSEFSIPAGGTSANYSVTVPSDTLTTDCRISYNFGDSSTTNGYSGYLPNGYYSVTGTTTDYNSASLVDVHAGNATGIDITVLAGTTISGIISMPQGMTAPIGGIIGSVYLSSQGAGGGGGIFTIPAGDSSANYTVTVPPNTAKIDYSVSYSLDNYYHKNGYSGYLSQGYYSSTGTTADRNLVSFVDISSGDLTGINLTILKGTTISGTIALPQGKTAPSGGFSGDINISSQNLSSCYASFYIPAGSSSASYTATVPISTAVTDYRVYCSFYDYGGSYVGNGYYSTTGTTTDYNLASLIDVSTGDATAINFGITTGKTISGTIELPSGMTAPTGGLSGAINITPENGWNNYTTNFSIPAGSSSAGFTVTVSTDTSITKYRLGYNFYNNNTSPYLGQGYYSSTGTTTNSNSASLIDVSAGDVTGKDLTILKGNIISGTITLPTGMTAPIGGLSGSVQIYPKNGGTVNSTQFSIPAGSDSASYTVTADPTITGYSVSYNLNISSNSPYLGNGYYSSTGTTTNYSSASQVNVNTGDATGINLTILKETTISGTIALPQGMSAPVGGISGSLQLYDSGNMYMYSTPFSISSGNSSTSYSISVNPTIAGYRISYSLDNSTSGSGYLSYGYYSSTGTMKDNTSATLVDVSTGDATGINLTLLKGTTISGTITLPSGMTAPTDGIEGYLQISPQNSGISYGSNFSISAGNSSASYTVTVDPTNTSYRISYSLGTSASGIGYLGNGYYAGTGTTTDYNSASLVDVSAGDVTGKDLTILKGNIISGTITLPPGMTAPTDGIAGYLNINSQNGGMSFSTQFSIPDGSSSTTYTISVDPSITNANYIMSYSLYNNSSGSGYLGYGYYSSTGTTTNSNSASLIDVSAGDVTGKDLTILKGNIISGTITLPQVGTTTGSAVSGSICISSSTLGNYYASFNFNIPSGSSSANYTVTVPANSSGQGYHVNYSLYNDNGGSYLTNGYYSSTGTTSDSNSASLVDVSTGDATGIDLTILANGTTTTPQAITLNLDNANVSLTTGQAIQLQATITPDTVTDKSVSWTIVSQGPVEVITLSNNGLLTALQPGSAVIRATSNADPTISAECSVTVTAPTTAGDNSTLLSTISLAQSNYNSAIEGTAVGQYVVGSKAILQAAITSAQMVVNAGTPTSAEIALAVTSLTDAMNVFEAGKVQASTNTSNASPIIQVGVNPDAGNIAGMYIGLDKIVDATGKPILNAKISGYRIEVDYDPNQVSIPDAMDQTGLGSLFTKNCDNMGKVLVSNVSDSGISNPNKLFFIPMVLKGSATDQPNITIKYLEIRDTNLHSISVPTVDSSSNLYTLQRGKIYNGESSVTPNIADAVAGLQYLAQLRNAGNGPEDVNLVNMASITESTNSNEAKPDMKDVIALLQYTVDLRDGYFTSAKPQLSLSQNNINSGYTTPVTITAIGTKTHFATGVTQLNIYNSNNQDLTGNSTLTVQSTTQASITLAPNLGAGNYTFELTTGSEKTSAAFTVSAAQQRVASINFLSNALTLSSSTTGSAIGFVPYNVLDQSGVDITNSSLAQSVVFQSSAGSVTAYQGILELTPLAGLDLRKLSQVIITGNDPQSGITTSAALTISSPTGSGGSTTSSAISALSISQLNKSANTDNKVLLPGVTSSVRFIDYTAADQSGNTTKGYDAGLSDLILNSRNVKVRLASGSLVAAFEGNNSCFC